MENYSPEIQPLREPARWPAVCLQDSSERVVELPKVPRTADFGRYRRLTPGADARVYDPDAPTQPGGARLRGAAAAADDLWSGDETTETRLSAVLRGLVPRSEPLTSASIVMPLVRRISPPPAILRPAPPPPAPIHSTSTGPGVVTIAALVLSVAVIAGATGLLVRRHAAPLTAAAHDLRARAADVMHRVR